CFSSRRRHTRSKRDWSSDVCSSDLMTTSGEIIRKILLDESIHGVFTGLDAQVLKAELSQEEQDRADKEMYELLNDLYENEVAYTKDLYDQIGLTDDVVNYLQYNANKALANLGYDP